MYATAGNILTTICTLRYFWPKINNRFKVNLPLDNYWKKKMRGGYSTCLAHGKKPFITSYMLSGMGKQDFLELKNRALQVIKTQIVTFFTFIFISFACLFYFVQHNKCVINTS